jgi:1,6-anhydro-N-acetylmuramate kinase
MASPEIISALSRALSLSRVLERAPGAASTRRDAERALAELMAAATADPVSALPEAQVKTLQQLLTSGGAAPATLAARALLALLEPGAFSSSSGGARLCQVRAHQG